MDKKTASKGLKDIKVKGNVTSSASEQTVEDLRAIVAKLRAELDVERKTSRQLRREKAIEVQDVHEQEQTKASICLKDLATKLHQEAQQEVELQKENLRCKLEADLGKVTKLKDQEIKKLRQDLAKCQEELKQEVAKRGLSTSARATFELERGKLLQEVKELSVSKKQLEEALRFASEAERRKNHEIRQLQDSCKLELARVEKEASLEVKKLLDELKSKDNMLSMMDRNLYPDKANLFKQRVENLSIEELLNLSREVEKMTKTTDNNRQSTSSSTDVCAAVSGGCALQSIALQKRLYELEKQLKFANGVHQALIDKNSNTAAVNKQLETTVRQLTDQINSLNCELSMSKAEIKRLNDVLVTATSVPVVPPESHSKCSEELSALSQRHEELQKTVCSMRLDVKEKERQIGLLTASQQKHKQKNSNPKTVRFLLPDDDKEESMNSSREWKSDDDELEINNPLIRPSSSSSDIFQFNDIDYNDENVHKDYEMLLAEHLSLEKYCATLMAAQTTAVQNNFDETRLEKESLNLAILALEKKLQEAADIEQALRCQLEEVCNQNEDLEFRILELEECTENTNSTFRQIEEFTEHLANNRLVESKLFTKHFKEIDINEMENNALQHESEISELTVFRDHHQLSLENLRMLTTSGLSDTDDDDNPMAVSYSTATSGFDEISCTSFEFDGKIESTEAAQSFSEKSSQHQLSSSLVSGTNETVGRMNVAIQCDEKELASTSVNINEEAKNRRDVDSEKRSADLLSELENVRTQLALSVEREQRMRDQFVLFEEEKNQRIHALCDQVDMLQDNELRLSETIKVLEELEQSMNTLDHETQEQNNREQPVSEPDQQFWTTSINEIANDKIFVKNALAECIAERKAGHFDANAQTEVVLEDCSRKLTDTAFALDLGQQIVCDLDLQIGLLETAKASLFEDDITKSRFNAVKNGHTPSEQILLAELGCSETEAPKVSSLKMCAFQAVIRGFETEFREMKDLTNKFLTVLDSERSDMDRMQADASVAFDTETKSAGTPHSLRVNINCPATDKLFDFVSPTSLQAEWSISGSLDLMRFGMHQQMCGLEKERDELQQLVYKDQNIIEQLNQRIIDLECSENNLRNLVERLETAEKHMRENILEMETYCESLQSAITEQNKREQDFKCQLVQYEANETVLTNQLHNALEESQQNLSKLNEKSAEWEQVRASLENHAKELSDLIGNAEGRETLLKQRVRLLESQENELRSKLSETEAALNATDEELIMFGRQKDSMLQRANSLESENADLKVEISELKEENGKQLRNVSELVETEIFLREANRKLWLSLQANIDDLVSSGERKTSRSELSPLSNDVSVSETEEKKIQSETIDPEFLQVLDPVFSDSTGTHCYPVVVIEQAAPGFRKAFRYLSSKYPQIVAELIGKVIEVESSIVETTSSPETVETMNKFVTSMQINPKTKSNGKPQNADKNNEQLIDDVDDIVWNEAKGEERYWSIVEDPSDLYDVRDADQSHIWVNLEEIMCLNTDDLSMTLEFKDKKPKQTTTTQACPLKQKKTKAASAPQTSASLSSHIALARDEADTESIDEASEIQDEDDGALPVDGVRSIGTGWLISAQDQAHGRPGCSARARSAGAKVGQFHVPGSKLAGSLDSIDDSGMESMAVKPQMLKEKIALSDHSTQTSVHITLDTMKVDETNAILRMQLEQKDQNLIAQTNEVDRLSQEMKRWQREAVAASEEAANIASLLAATQEELQMIREASGDSRVTSSSSSSKLSPKKTRLEPHGSQIPVSIRLMTDDHNKNNDPLSLLFSLQSPTTMAATGSSSHSSQDSVYASSGLSLSKSAYLKFPSHLPRPIGDKSPPKSPPVESETRMGEDEGSFPQQSSSSSLITAAATAAAASARVTVKSPDKEGDSI